MLFQECSKKLTEKDINNFCKKFNLNINNNFISHYILWNGGYPTNIDSVLGVNNIFSMHGFNTIKYDNLTIEILAEDLKYFGLNKEGYTYLPFAYDTAGNMYLLSLDNYKVFLFIVEEEEFHETSWKSFGFFLNCFINYIDIELMDDKKKKKLKKYLFNV